MQTWTQVRIAGRASCVPRLASRVAAGLAAISLLLPNLARAAGEGLDGVPALDALVHHEMSMTLASGVTRTDIWQEHLVRGDRQVWSERILPTRTRHDHDESSEPHRGHKHLDVDRSGRWLRLAADGNVHLSLVDRERQMVVEIPKAEFSTVSFDGNFEAMAMLVPTSELGAMDVDSTATSDEGRWLVERNRGWTHRVLWSDGRKIALRIESRRDDGTASRTVSVTILRGMAEMPDPAEPAPWDLLSAYEQVAYDEFMD